MVQDSQLMIGSMLKMTETGSVFSKNAFYII